jgi:hypothetical protein
VEGSQNALVPVTPRAGWHGRHIYDILIERLERLERVLVVHGFQDPVPRIQFHLKILQRLSQKSKIDTDEILWSLVEATELADIYCCFPMVSQI